MEFKQFHGTSVVIEDCGIMIIGNSGSGKSDLALRLIDNGATLISDDITICKKKNKKIFLLPSKETRGLLEVREVGIITVPYVENIELRMIVELKNVDQERYPEHSEKTILGLKLPRLLINGKNPSSVIKVKVKLNEIKDKA